MSHPTPILHTHTSQGLALDPRRRLLYVADTLNDRVRVVDLKSRDAVSTLRPTNLDAKVRVFECMCSFKTRRDRQVGEVGMCMYV